MAQGFTRHDACTCDNGDFVALELLAALPNNHSACTFNRTPFCVQL